MIDNKIEDIQVKITTLIDTESEDMNDAEYVALLQLLHYEITIRINAADNLKNKSKI